VPNDIDIARAVTPRPIADVAAELGLDPQEWRSYGDDVAKIAPAVLEAARQRRREPHLILVSAITPTPAGEGKTTTSIGLAQGLARLGESACLALREPSLGPSLGMKGGATGGGRSWRPSWTTTSILEINCASTHVGSCGGV
jgi:formate--tetrahydrofolate ligase